VILKPFWLPRSASSERRDRLMFPVLAYLALRTPVCFVSSRSWPDPLVKVPFIWHSIAQPYCSSESQASLLDPGKGCPLRHFLSLACSLFRFYVPTIRWSRDRGKRCTRTWWTTLSRAPGKCCHTVVIQSI
jgi:hypothetical protein